MQTINNNFDSKVNKANNDCDDGDDSLSIEQVDQILLDPDTVDVLSQVLNDEKKPVKDNVASDLEVLTESVDSLIDLSNSKPTKDEELVIAQSIISKQFELGLKNLEKEIKVVVQAALIDPNLKNDTDTSNKLISLIQKINSDIDDLSHQDIANVKDAKSLIAKLSDDIAAFSRLVVLKQSSSVKADNIPGDGNTHQIIEDRVDTLTNLSGVTVSLDTDNQLDKSAVQINPQVVGDKIANPTNLSEIIASLKADTQLVPITKDKTIVQNFVDRLSKLDNLSEIITSLNTSLAVNNTFEQNNTNDQGVIQAASQVATINSNSLDFAANSSTYQSCAVILDQISDKIHVAYSELEDDITNNNLFPEYGSAFNDLFEQINTQIDSFKDFTTKLAYRNDADIDASALVKEKAASQKTIIRQAVEQALTNLGHTPESYTPITLLLDEDGKSSNGNYVPSARQLGGTTYTSDLINQLLTGSSNVSILLICMIAFLAMSDIDSMVIKADASQIVANQKYSQLLSRTQGGLQALQSILPYMDNSTNPPTAITDLYAICKIAYGNPGDPNLQRSLQPFADLMNSIVDSKGNSYWSQIDFTKDDVTDRNLLISSINGMIDDANQALAHVGSPSMPQFKMSDDSTKPGPLVDVSQLNAMTKSISDGTTAASSISQQANVVLQADNESLNQHIQAATTCLSVYKRINQSIWVQG